jgi:hypothetical protein
MKKSILILTMVCAAMSSFAQTDSTQTEGKTDTVRIGGMVIIKKGHPNDEKRVTVTVGNRRNENHSDISTSSFVFDLGFSNWTDKTNYTAATASNDAVGVSENDMKLKTGKSINVNLWFVIQRLSLIKNYLNLKYGFGLELNNYRFKSNVSFSEGGTNPHNPLQTIDHPFVFKDSINFKKDKLAADYLTVPIMLNLVSNPHQSGKGISLSGGVSVGYLYISRNKQRSSELGKEKNRGDYDLERWKFSYIGELGLGPVHLYGSYSPKSIFSNDLNFRPYTIGLRFSNW